MNKNGEFYLLSFINRSSVVIELFKLLIEMLIFKFRIHNWCAICGLGFYFVFIVWTYIHINGTDVDDYKFIFKKQ